MSDVERVAAVIGRLARAELRRSDYSRCVWRWYDRDGDWIAVPALAGAVAYDGPLGAETKAGALAARDELIAQLADRLAAVEA